MELVQVGGGPGDPRGARAASAADFEAQQAAVRAEGSKRLEAISDKAFNVVKKVCQDAAAARKRFERGEGSHADLDAGVDPSMKHRSMAQIREDAERRRSEHRRARRELAMLGRFIRLVDYIGVQALLDRSVGSVEGFLRSLQSPNRRTGVFEISVYLEAQAAAGQNAGSAAPAAAERRWGVAGDDEAVARFARRAADAGDHRADALGARRDRRLGPADPLHQPVQGARPRRAQGPLSVRRRTPPAPAIVRSTTS